MPKKGPDKEKIKRLRQILRKNPNGIWVRELARKSNMAKTTVSYYINKFLKNEIEEILSGGKGFVKIIRLKK